MKFEPVTLRLKSVPPAGIELGLRVKSAGVGLGPEMVNDNGFELPALGVKAVTLAAPAVAISLAGMNTISRVVLTNDPERLAPLNRITVLVLKLEPSTVKLKAEPPAAAVFGVRSAISGKGPAAPELAAVKKSELEVPPPGVAVMMLTLDTAAEAISRAGTVAVRVEGLIKEVSSDAPFHCTVEPLIKPLPVSVSVKEEPPAVEELGLIAARIGVGFVGTLVCSRFPLSSTARLFKLTAPDEVGVQE